MCINRGHLTAHPWREEIAIDPRSTTCFCCGGKLHVIGEHRSERLALRLPLVMRRADERWPATQVLDLGASLVLSNDRDDLALTEPTFAHAHHSIWMQL